MHNYKKVFNIFEKKYTTVPLEKFKSPYQALISTVMSARTNDNTTLLACNRLFIKAKNIKTLSEIDVKEIEKLIYPVGFYKTKAKHIKELSQRIINEHKGVIPSNTVELMKLPGVGIKTANLVVNRAFDTHAISVDTHVHYITNLLGWVKTKTPEQTLRELEKTLPKKYWKDINKLFVSIGRQYTSRKKLVEFLKREKLI